MIRLIIFFIFFLIHSSLYSQSIKKAYRFYEKGEIIKFRESLYKMDKKMEESSGKYYLYSLLFLEEKEDRKKLDSSFYFINKSKSIFKNNDPKEIETLDELKISINSIDSIIHLIDSLEFNFVLDINTIYEYKQYMNHHVNSSFKNHAKLKWHSLEFQKSSTINTWESYKLFKRSKKIYG